MAKTRGGGKVGSRRSRRNQGLEVVDQGLEDKRPQLKVKKATAKKTASPKKSLVLTPTRRSSRIKKVAAQDDDELEDVTPDDDDDDDELEDVTPEYIPRVDEVEDVLNGKEAEEDGDGIGKEAEEDGDGNEKEAEEDGDGNGKENEDEQANMEDDGVLNEKGNEEEARDMEEDGTAQDDEIPSTEGVELGGEEVQKKKKRTNKVAQSG